MNAGSGRRYTSNSEYAAECPDLALALRSSFCSASLPVLQDDDCATGPDMQYLYAIFV